MKLEILLAKEKGYGEDIAKENVMLREEIAGLREELDDSEAGRATANMRCLELSGEIDRLHALEHI